MLNLTINATPITDSEEFISIYNTVATLHNQLADELTIKQLKLLTQLREADNELNKLFSGSIEINGRMYQLKNGGAC